MTVSAAYSGYTVTEDIIDLADTLRSPIEDEEDLRRYVAGIVNLARDSRQKAETALKELRSIRQEIMKVRGPHSRQPRPPSKWDYDVHSCNRRWHLRSNYTKDKNVSSTTYPLGNDSRIITQQIRLS